MASQERPNIKQLEDCIDTTKHPPEQRDGGYIAATNPIALELLYNFVPVVQLALSYGFARDIPQALQVTSQCPPLD